jgi:hypothetical protein
LVVVRLAVQTVPMEQVPHLSTVVLGLVMVEVEAEAVEPPEETAFVAAEAAEAAAEMVLVDLVELAWSS